MSIFGDLDVDLDDVSGDPFEIKDGTHKAVVSGFELKESNAGNKGISITYSLSDPDDPSHGLTVKEWKALPSETMDTTTLKNTKNWLKQRLLSLGVPENRCNTVTAEDVMGVQVVVTTKKNGDFTNVNRVALDETPAFGATTNPFAQADF